MTVVAGTGLVAFLVISLGLSERYYRRRDQETHQSH
jgi:hypothetical protein